MQKNQRSAFARLFLLSTAILIVIGIFFIYSSSSVYALATFGNAHYYLKRHIIGLALGLVALISVQFVPVWLMRTYAPLFFIASTLLTALTLIPRLTQTIHGSSRWLSFGGFAFQPSELLKIGLIMYIASLLAKQRDRNRADHLRGYIPILVALGITSALLLKQPDFGLAVTLVLTIFTLLFIAHAYLRYMLYTILITLPCAIILVLIKPYRLRRVVTFLNPWKDPQGAGFQIIQSLIAIGSGGWGGVGIAQSKQKFFYLPMQHTDFIFSIIAEETGFVGCTFLIIILAVFLYAGLHISLKLQDTFASLTTAGLVLLISLQSIINIAVANGILPTKGIGLPFVSYGNSALIAHLIMVGIIVRFVHHEK
jgi:cell division protein FtsW